MIEKNKSLYGRDAPTSCNLVGGASVQLDINFICQSRPYNCIFENASAKAVLIGSFASFACFRK